MAESPRCPRLGPGFRMEVRCPPTGAGFWVGTGGKGARVPAWDTQGCGAARPASAESPAQHTGLRSDPSAGRGTYERGRGHGPTEQPSPAGQPGGRGDRDRKELWRSPWQSPAPRAPGRPAEAVGSAVGSLSPPAFAVGFQNFTTGAASPRPPQQPSALHTAGTRQILQGSGEPSGLGLREAPASPKLRAPVD
ncbi:hypothetical protein R6Z07F_014837 [Ovis aries]